MPKLKLVLAKIIRKENIVMTKRTNFIASILFVLLTVSCSSTSQQDTPTNTSIISISPTSHIDSAPVPITSVSETNHGQDVGTDISATPLNNSSEKNVEPPTQDNIFIIDNPISAQGGIFGGVAFKSTVPSNVYAVEEGVVSKVEMTPVWPYGLHVVITTESGKNFTYGFLSEINVGENDIVSVGDVVGITGSTGASEHDNQCVLNVVIQTETLETVSFYTEYPRVGENKYDKPVYKIAEYHK